MVSAGHDNPPGVPLNDLSIGDEFYAFLDPRGYLARGKATRTAVLAGEFVVAGDFIAKDGSGRGNRESGETHRHPAAASLRYARGWG